MKTNTPSFINHIKQPIIPRFGMKCFDYLPKYKKSVETYQLPAPQSEAVGLPVTVETSNYDPTPICSEPIAIHIRLKIRANV